MGYVTPNDKRDEEQPGGGSGLHLDLDETVCPTCRRALLPWQEHCPDDGARGVARTDLPSAMPPPPAHLLADEDDPGNASDPS